MHFWVSSVVYLPASWYHEVTSFSSTDESSPGHLAFNFWFHPPATTSATFAAPYSDEYWSTWYRNVVEATQLELRLMMLQRLNMSGNYSDVAEMLKLFDGGILPACLNTMQFGSSDAETGMIVEDDDDDDDGDTFFVPPPCIDSSVEVAEKTPSSMKKKSANETRQKKAKKKTMNKRR